MLNDETRLRLRWVAAAFSTLLIENTCKLGKAHVCMGGIAVGPAPVRLLKVFGLLYLSRLWVFVGRQEITQRWDCVTKQLSIEFRPNPSL